MFLVSEVQFVVRIDVQNGSLLGVCANLDWKDVLVKKDILGRKLLGIVMWFFWLFLFYM